MKENKNIIIVLLILLLGVSLVYIGCDKIMSGKGDNIEDKNNQEIDDNINKDNKLYSYILNYGEKFNENLVINSENVNFSLNNNKFYVNNYQIELKGIEFFPQYVYIYQDLLFIDNNTSEKKYYEIYDLNGNLLKTFDDKMIKYVQYGEIRLSNEKKLLIEVINSGITGPYVNDNLMLCGCGQCPTNNANKYISEIKNTEYYSRANYEIIYNKETKQIDIKLDSITETLEEYLNDKILKNGEWCVTSVNN